MAQDSSPNQNPNQEVDLDEIEVDILIICRNVKAMTNTASFLTRRGWPTSCLDNMGMAVEHIAEKKPDFILVSMSHPNPSVVKLPELITQTFNLMCVGFIETFDSASQNRLNAMKLRYKVQGQASGPNVHRTIRKILAEKFNVGQDDKDATKERKKSDDGSESVTVKGSNRGSTIIQQSTKGPSGSASGAIVVKGKGTAAGGDDGDDESSANTVMGTPGGRGSKGPAYMGQLGEDSGESEGHDTGEDQGSGVAYMGGTDDGATGGPGKKSGSVWGPSGPARKTGHPSYSEENLDGAGSNEGEHEQRHKRARKSLKELTGAAIEPGEASGNLLQGEDLGLPPELVKPQESKEALVDKLKTSLFGDGPDLTVALQESAEATAVTEEPASLLEKAVEDALSRVCKKLEDETEFTPLGRLSHLAVVPVDSGEGSGYLVIGMEPSSGGEKEFLKNVEQALADSFSALNVPGKLEPGFWIQMPPIPFMDWAGENANFEVVVPHDKSEVAVAFFALSRPIPKPEEGVDDMLAVKIEDIATNQPINFKAYIHLKKNQKYFLYLRDGRRLQEKQKAKLAAKKVQRIYMKKDEAEKLRSYFASSFLKAKLKKAS